MCSKRCVYGARQRYLCLDKVPRGDLPTLVRRTASVCPVGVRPRAPRCAGERSGRASWIRTHRASCRGDRTLLTVFSQRLLWLYTASTLTRPPRIKREKMPLPVSSWLTCAFRPEDDSAYSPFPTLPAAECSSFELFSLSTRCSGWESLERLDWESERWDDLWRPPTPPLHTRARIYVAGVFFGILWHSSCFI